CINIHHGLLPEQRGAMCDLWALFMGRPAGFSVHVMTPAVDAGPILAREQVSDGTDCDYPAYLLKSSRRERNIVTALLAGIEEARRLEGVPNIADPGLKHYWDPTPGQIREMRRKGLVL
ncbi:MAG: hypothetical protein KKC51_13940, partial [Verrucomicrobia bacterium]|nr:hypothetical protein [Verrucomicrobiota bacterium]